MIELGSTLFVQASSWHRDHHHALLIALVELLRQETHTFHLLTEEALVSPSPFELCGLTVELSLVP